MIFPLFPRGLFGGATGLLVGTVIGMAFGFVLERAGFGRARNLAAQFYLTDLRVLKVMFSAIVTALLGMTVLSGMGVIDMTKITVPETFLGPQIVGGLLLGAGFIVSGYCPGTSVAAAASGNLDGLAAIGGMMAGSLAFGFGFSPIRKFYESGARGVVRFSDLAGVPAAVLAVAVVVIAVGAFIGGEKVERILSARSGKPAPESPRAAKRRVFGGFAIGAAAGLVLLAVPQPQVALPPSNVQSIDALALAGRVASAPEDLWLLDLRPANGKAAERIPGSLALDPADEAGARIAELAPARLLVVYGQGDLRSLPAGVSRYPGTIAVLRGGFDAWRREVLDAPGAPASPSPAAIAQFRLQSALHSRFTGSAAVEPPKTDWKPAAAAPAAPRKGGGC
jgi:hypothetical protein